MTESLTLFFFWIIFYLDLFISALVAYLGLKYKQRRTNDFVDFGLTELLIIAKEAAGAQACVCAGMQIHIWRQTIERCV